MHSGQKLSLRIIEFKTDINIDNIFSDTLSLAAFVVVLVYVEHIWHLTGDTIVQSGQPKES